MLQIILMSVSLHHGIAFQDETRKAQQLITI